ncbi:J domain-containing protein [Maricaulis sp.]|uniref:J domain-containing protein n=1 Tax=Maricaulis sp. TaxID=1486257 RepID=UPI00260882C5|nr:J domain-containing protein [Maricaulis sp.]
MLFSLIAGMALLAAGWWFARQKTSDAVRATRIVLMAGALIAGTVISLRGVPALGIPLGLFGLAMMRDIVRPAAGGQSSRPGGQHGQPSSTGPSAMTAAQAREVLGVSDDAGETEIQTAYRSLMKKLHPDTGEGSAALTRQVQAARDLLLDQIQKNS